jgi:SAM-dependent methyltransferase
MPKANAATPAAATAPAQREERQSAFSRWSSVAATQPMPKWRYLWNAVRHPAKRPTNHTFFRQLLLQPRVFDLVSCVLQLFQYRRLDQIKATYASPDAFLRKVQDYNAGVTVAKEITTGRRAEPLYHSLTLERRDVQQERLLIIGPRNVQELFIAWLYGYRWQHIDAIDLYSMHPKIRVMDMEHMTFADSSFDAVVMSNTLSYAKDTFRCLAEVCRVLKPSGRFAFEAVYSPQDTQWPGSLIPGNEIRQMLKRLGLGFRSYRSFDRVNALGELQTTHVFCVQKDDLRQPSLDRIEW